MSSTAVATLTYPYPPPTTNTLDSQQRARLIRSTRKLGALLGTTPYLLEGDAPIALLPLGTNKKYTSKALKRQGSIFSHHQTKSSLTSLSSSSSTSLLSLSSSSSLVSLPHSVGPGRRSADLPSSKSTGVSGVRGRHSADKPQPLYLRLNTVPISPTDSRLVSPSSPIAAQTPSNLPGTPCTPTFSTADPVEIRRKRMAKLARHLGENIPPELVPAPERPSFSEEQRPKKRTTSFSYVFPKDTPFVPMPEIHTKPTPNQDWVGQWNRSDIRQVQQELRNLRSR
ncbi:hypothetical protein ID866_6063 [Astraeus odoratus]|nr:hypothetical protein ID866_6063 [Astraeus odoratus]